MCSIFSADLPLSSLLPAPRVVGDAAGSCCVDQACVHDNREGNSSEWNPPHRMWQDANNSRPETAIMTVSIEIQFTSLHLVSRINESHVLKAVGNSATSDGVTPADFELRVVDANVSVFLPSLRGPWAPPTLISGECSNIISFQAYFIGDNVTTIKQIKSLFDDPGAGEGRLSLVLSKSTTIFYT